MRNLAILMAATSLAACGGGGPTTVGTDAVGTSTGTSGTGTPTPTSTSSHTFVTPTVTKTYQSQAAAQKYSYESTELLYYNKKPVMQQVAVFDANGQPVLDAQGKPTFTMQQVLDSTGTPLYTIDKNSRRLLATAQDHQLYTGSATTVRSPGVTVTYDPRNAQFSLAITANGLTDNISFQDPAHRTDFSGLSTPQAGVPNLEVGDPTVWRTKGVQYLQADTGSTETTYDVSTFLYDLPNAATHQYVTFAGFVRNHYEKPVETVTDDQLTYQVTSAAKKTIYERAAFVFGEQTLIDNVPKTGTATYTGGMIASMVNNPLFDTNPSQGSYFQWISGKASVGVDFATGKVSTSLTGTTMAPLLDSHPLLTPTDTSGVTFDGVVIPAGATFSATGSALIDLVTAGGFTGTFSNAQFSGAGLAGVTKVDIVGSSIDGAFYGPKGEEVGASFRIVGGIPDQRVDIIGAFTGKKP